MKRIAFFALAALLAAACQNELAPEKEGRDPLDAQEFYASLEAPDDALLWMGCFWALRPAA